MEIHPHIGRSSPAHSHHHNRYPQAHTANDYYLQQGQYSGRLSVGDSLSQFDFMNTQNPQIDVKSEQIKMEIFESPSESSPLIDINKSPSKMLLSSSPTHRQNTSDESQSILGANCIINYAGFPTHLSNVLANDASNSLDSKHNRKRPYPCAMCSSRFGSKMELEEHQNSHTGSKPFECDVCQSRFNRRSTLWNHKRIHSDAKPFSCTVCQMTFKWKNSLKCHKEMHMRKNETTTAMDNDIKLLTYATAAKKKMAESSANGLPPAAAIQTVSSRKKPISKKANRVKRELQEQTVSTTTTSLSLSLFGGMDSMAQLGGGLLNASSQGHEPSETSQHLAITHTSAQQHQQQLDLTQFNHSNLLMQAIYSGNQNTPAIQQTQQLDEASALDLMNSSSSTQNSSASAANLNLDLQQSLFLDNSQFLTDGMRLPAAFPMNILDFQQQLTDRQQQHHLSYIQQPQQHQMMINMGGNQNSMLGYSQRDQQLSLDEMQSLYQQTLDPSALLLNQTASNSHHSQHHHQPHSQSAQTHVQHIPPDQFSDFMLNGTPVYPFNADGSVSICNPNLQQPQQQLSLGSFTSVTNNSANMPNFGLIEEVPRISPEELQNLAKFLPYDNKW